MKFTSVLSLFVASAAALPTSTETLVALEGRQAESITRDDLSNGAAGDCPGQIFIFARGSTELGNLVSYFPNRTWDNG